MPQISEAGFLKALSERAGFCPNSAEIYGRGAQSIVALSHGGNVFKAFMSGKECGISSAGREAAILKAIGGYSGFMLDTPELKSHIVFNEPFHWEDKKFVSAVEQSFVPGDPAQVIGNDAGRIGNALAELHTLLKQRRNDIPLVLENILESRLAMIKPGGFILSTLPKAHVTYLQRHVGKLLETSSLQPVHGDFVSSNIIAGQTGKYAVLDYARVGLSIPEQDMTLYAAWPLMLKDVFKTYASVTGYVPQEKHVMTLQALNIAVGAEMAAAKGDHYKSGRLARDLSAMLKQS